MGPQCTYHVSRLLLHVMCVGKRGGTGAEPPPKRPRLIYDLLCHGMSLALTRNSAPTEDKPKTAPVLVKVHSKAYLYQNLAGKPEYVGQTIQSLSVRDTGHLEGDRTPFDCGYSAPDQYLLELLEDCTFEEQLVENTVEYCAFLDTSAGTRVLRYCLPF